MLEPPGSLTSTGSPSIGGEVTFRIDNPLNSQSPNSLALLLISTVPATTAPQGCGTTIPGAHMSPSQPSGELLVLPPFAAELLGPLWSPGQPVEIDVAVPNNPNLLGLDLYVQGVILDPTGGPSGNQTVGLTRGRKLRIGT